MKSETKAWKRVLKDPTFRSFGGIILVIVIVSVLLAIRNPNFMTTSNILNILRQISVNAIIAFGMTYCILLGGIDLSVGAVICVGGVLCAKVINAGANIYLGILSGIAVGVAAGLFNGILVSRTGIPAFVVTLCSQSICNGMAYILTKGSPISCNNEQFTWFGNGYIAEIIPVPVIIMLIIFAITLFLLVRTSFGKHLYAIGGNRDCARYAGINIERDETICYVISGTLAGVAGVILAARMYSGQPNAGEGMQMDAIAAAVIGGTSLKGGVGTILGTICGSLIIGVINNGMDLLNVNMYWQEIVKGVIIVVAVVIDAKKHGKKS